MLNLIRGPFNKDERRLTDYPIIPCRILFWLPTLCQSLILWVRYEERVFVLEQVSKGDSEQTLAAALQYDTSEGIFSPPAKQLAKVVSSPSNHC